MENQIKTLLDPEVQAFIAKNEKEDISKLALQKNPFPQIPWPILLNQIEARAKAKAKLPTFYKAPNIIFPAKVSVEQTSSEITANYKSTLVNGASLIDITGGFGVDCYYFSKVMKQVYHCEMNADLSEIVSHNFKQLQVENITCLKGDSSEILEQLQQQFDWMYIDPSRRNEVKGKVFLLQDCLPNVPELLDFYFQFTSNILIKTAPILDLSACANELKSIKSIHIVAVANEVKELLWELQKEFSGPIIFKTINILESHQETFDFEWQTPIPEVTYELPKQYLYEPNAAIMKSGGFQELAIRYQISKLHPHSHLYTSDQLIDFPGRRFSINKNVAFQKKEMKTHLEHQKMNITTRNFPETVADLRKKWNIKEGGAIYTFFTTNCKNERLVLVCEKM